MPSLPPPIYKGNGSLIKYRIHHSDLIFKHPIGGGAYSQVWVGVYKHTGQVVAIKKMLQNVMDERHYALYMREVANLASLKHRFLLPFIGYTDISPYCIVTKYIENGSLYNALNDDPMNLNLTPTDYSVIAYGIALCMEYLHTNRVIHRDLKTQNVLIDANKLPVICDLGSSRSLEGQKTVNMNVGTLIYMAPEFIKNEDYSEKVDVYAFGMCLWEMVTHETPFYGLKDAQIICQVTLEGQRPMIPSGTNPEIVDLIQACWSENPNDRPTFRSIVTRMATGDVLFQDADRQVFLQTIKNLTHPSPRRLSNASMELLPRPSGSPHRRMNSAIISSPELKKIPVFAEDKARTLSTLLFALPDGTPKHVEMALSFIENNVFDDCLCTPILWSKLLALLIRADERTQVRIRLLLENLQRSRKLLSHLPSDHEMSMLVSTETMDFFLSVISNNPDSISVETVEALKILCLNTDSWPNSIILLIKLLDNGCSADLAKNIAEFLVEIAPSCVEMHKSYVVLQTLHAYGICDSETLSLYLSSSNIETVAYAVSVAITMSLPIVPSTVINALLESSQHRDTALEYILCMHRNFENMSLVSTVESLVRTIIDYQCKHTELVLLKLISAEGNETVMLLPKIRDLWSNSRPNVAFLFIRAFIIVFRHRPLAAVMTNMPNFLDFLDNSAKSGLRDPLSLICWFLNQIDMNSSFSDALSQSPLLQTISSAVQNNRSTIRMKEYCDLITKLSLIRHFDIFDEVISMFIRFLSTETSEYLTLLACLAALSHHKETLNVFLDANIYAILVKYSDRDGAQVFIKDILSSFRALGVHFP